MVFPLAGLGLFGFRTLQVTQADAIVHPELNGLHITPGQAAPDIYYIILDGYSRDDMLEKFYKLDNRLFLNQLSKMGFYVARCSQSNYAQTQLSLASSLNFNYLESLGDQYKPGNTSRVGLPEFIKHSATREALESLGYQVVAFETGFEATQFEDADHYFSSKAVQGINDFENLFVRTTAGRIMAEGVAFLNLRPDWEARDQAHRERVLFTLDKLKNIRAVKGPKFVFAHIVSPHWPHVFGPNGESVHEHPDSVSGYRDQVVFINTQIVPILSEIIAHSNPAPVIVLQGDHGAIIESPARRMSILNAYYLPASGHLLYENISPVNTFRIIFNSFFGSNAALLQDLSYYSRYEHPFEFQIVPNERPGCQ
jgi:hypothetical protein